MVRPGRFVVRFGGFSSIPTTLMCDIWLWGFYLMLDYSVYCAPRLCSCPSPFSLCVAVVFDLLIFYGDDIRFLGSCIYFVVVCGGGGGGVWRFRLYVCHQHLPPLVFVNVCFGDGGDDVCPQLSTPTLLVI